MKLRRRLSTLIIIIGVGIAIFPLLQKGFAAYNQWLLNREFEQQSRAAQQGKSSQVGSQGIGEEWLDFFRMRKAEAATRSPRRSVSQSNISRDPLLQRSRHTPSRPMGLVRIEIPKLNVRAIVVDGTDGWQLAKGPAHFIGTALPGENGNCAIAAHRNVYGSWFKDLNLLRAGDEVILRTPRQAFTYRVTQSKIVMSNNTAVLDRTQKPTLTLVTCMIPYAKHRLVVWALKS